MKVSDRNAAIAAAVILGVFLAAGLAMPSIMLAAGGISPLLAVVIAAAFIAAFFLVFRARSKASGASLATQTLLTGLFIAILVAIPFGLPFLLRGAGPGLKWLLAIAGIVGFGTALWLAGKAGEKESEKAEDN